MRFLLLAVGIFLFMTQAGQAAEFQVAGQTLSISPPHGYCALDRNNPSDAPVIERLEKSQAGRNQVLMSFALCSELADWRAGRIPYYKHYGNVTVQLQDGSPQKLQSSRADFIASMEETMPKIDPAEVDREVSTRTGEITGSQLLGIIGKDSNALYIGLLVSLKAEGQPIVLAGVTSFTLLKSIVVNTNLYEPASADAHEHLLSIQQPYLAQLVQRNP